MLAEVELRLLVDLETGDDSADGFADYLSDLTYADGYVKDIEVLDVSEV